MAPGHWNQLGKAKWLNNWESCMQIRGASCSPLISDHRMLMQVNVQMAAACRVLLYNIKNLNANHTISLYDY